MGAAPICINRLRRHLTCEGLREEANVAAGPLPRGICFQRLVALEHWHLGRVGHPSRANHLLPQQSSAEGYVGTFIAAAPARRSILKNGHEAACQGTQAHASEASLKLGDAVASPEVGRNGYGCSWKACLRR